MVLMLESFLLFHQRLGMNWEQRMDVVLHTAPRCWDLDLHTSMKSPAEKKGGGERNIRLTTPAPFQKAMGRQILLGSGMTSVLPITSKSGTATWRWTRETTPDNNTHQLCIYQTTMWENFTTNLPHFLHSTYRIQTAWIIHRDRSKHS